MCLLLCQYCSVLITVALKNIMKSGGFMPLILFFLPKIPFLLWFHIGFRIFFSYFVKKKKEGEAFRTFMLITLIWVLTLGNMDILILIFQSMSMECLPFICVLLNFFHQYFIVFRVQVFHLNGYVFS